jgi:2-amino-4-hydroxy-6-hydroxymethyldihydropteridine diphosphokinase
MMVSQVFLSLGTNMGQRRVNLRRAVVGLTAGMTITAVSPVYETEPWGGVEQPSFLNLCLAGATSKTALDLLLFCKTVEVVLGRQPSVRWGPRLIDIDLLFYDDLIQQDKQLTLPHPRLEERAFVLAPLADIAADFVHPQNGLTVAQMLAAVDVSTVRKTAEPLFAPGSEEWKAVIA